jgi:hypothetical protein
MLYHAIGNAIVTEEELRSRSMSVDLSSFKSAKKAPPSLTFSTGVLSKDTFVTGLASAKGQPVPLQDIGLGRPLCIMITQIYTGQYPKALLAKTKDMLLASAVKSIAVYDAKPLALNFLKQDVGPKTRLDRPAASEQGTPFVFYSPALIEGSLTLDLSMTFDRFPSEVFNAMSAAVTKASAIPMFLAQGSYLVAAGMLLKLVGQAGELLFDHKPSFSKSEALNISWPGLPPLPPGFILVTDGNVDAIDPGFRAKYEVNPMGLVVDKAGNQYAGNIPYVVLLVDGTAHAELSSFTPTAATAAVLSRFLGLQNKQQASLDLLVDAVRLYNDVRFRREIDDLEDQIKGLKADDPERARLEEKRDALKKNILEKLLKP